MTFHYTIELIKDKPVIALIVGATHLGFSAWLHDHQIPLIIKDVLQCGAWATTITVGCITIYGAYKKWRKK